MPPKKAIVVGAGFGGIAMSLRLRRLGYDVSVLDNNPKAGGRAQVYELGEYKFDGGPTVITAPFLFDELFELFGKKRSDYVDFLRVEPWYRFEFADGSKLDYGGQLEDTIAEIDRISPGEGSGYQKLVAFSKKIFAVGFEKLADQPFHRFQTMMKQVPALMVLKSYLSVYSLVSSFLRDDRLRRAFSIHPLLVGGNPLQTTSIYCLIHYLERKWGVWFPRGGTGALVQALVKLMGEVGVKLELNQQVDKVIVDGNRACGIRLNTGEEKSADLVVFDADPPKVYRDLIDPRYRSKWSDSRLKRLSFSMGLFVWYFGTSRTYPDVEHHTIIMGKAFKELLEDIYDKKILSDDLSLYLHRPAATDESMAPENKDAFYVLAPVPNKLAKINWQEAGERIRAQVQAQLEQTLLPGLGDCLDVSHFVTPDDFEGKFNTLWGSGFSIAPLFRQSAWFRFHNRSEDIENLYFCGAGTHPGAGVPGVVSSAKVVEKLVPPSRLSNETSFQEIFRSKSRTFSLASLLLPKERAEAIFRLYYVCRTLDDWADEGEGNKLKDAMNCWENHHPHELLDHYRFLQARWGLASLPLTELMEAMIGELDGVRIQTEDELIKYCHGVAGTIGLMTCPIFGVSDPDAMKHADDLGIAMQLTNICRDVYEDAESDRIYLPADFFENIPSVEGILSKNPESVAEISQIKTRLLSLADDRYASGEAGIRYLPMRMRIVVRWAGHMYREIGELIKRDPSLYHANRAVVTGTKKMRILLPCLIKAFVS
uniref:Phytoene dehydrogenase n=1 Tax=uncultured marine bacterium HF10_49E08 TaxID=415447 RepID=A4GIB8_9BACT|nr:crtI/crtB [uncultured marine bacterium HF10_49E08]